MAASHKPQGRQPELGPADRVVAVLLAVVWLAGGLAALVLALSHHGWLGLLLGPPAVGYGILWVRVAQTGRRLRWPLRRRRPSGDNQRGGH